MSVKLTNEQFKERLENKGTYLLLSDYTNMQSLVKVKCKKCGHETEIKAQNASTFGCKECSKDLYGNAFRFDLNKFKEYLVNYTDSKYEHVSGEYKNAKSPIVVKHIECGSEFITNLDLLKQGYCVCRNCITRKSMSKGEFKVFEILKDMNLKFQEQYSFDDLIFKSKLRFDFAVFNDDNSLNFLIEYDGEGHYIEGIFGNDVKRGFDYVKIRDKIKDEYCNENNIKLLRIPYFELKNAKELIKNMI